MNIPLEIQFQRNDNNEVMEAATTVAVGQQSRFSSGSGSNKDQVPKLMLPKTSGHRTRGLEKTSSAGSKGDQTPKLMLPKSSEHRRGLGVKALPRKTKRDTIPAIPRKQSSIHSTTLSLSPCSPNNNNNNNNNRTKTRNLQNRRGRSPALRLSSHCFNIEPTAAASSRLTTTRAFSSDDFILRDIIVPGSSGKAQHPSFRKPSKSF